MYVCLCNGISDKKFVRLCASFPHSFQQLKNLFRSAISAVNVSGPRVK